MKRKRGGNVSIEPTSGSRPSEKNVIQTGLASPRLSVGVPAISFGNTKRDSQGGSTYETDSDTKPVKRQRIVDRLVRTVQGMWIGLQNYLNFSLDLLVGNRTRCFLPFFIDLLNLEERDGVLHLNHTLPNTKLRAIVIRECYRGIVSDILESRGQKVLISGTPGVGKSVLLLYLLWSLIGKRERILFVSHPRLIYYDGYGGVYHMHHLPPFSDTSFWNPDLFVLFDAKQKSFSDLGLFAYDECTFVVSSSPRRDLVNDYVKGGVNQFFVPPWTEDEMVHLSTFHRSVVDWRYRYDFLGGIPRNVFEDCSVSPETLVTRACQNCDLINCIKLTRENAVIGDKSQIIHCLIHITSEAPYRTSAVQYASRKVLDVIVKEHGDTARRELQSLLSASDGHPIIASLCGYIFEPYAIDMLSRGGDFECRPLVHGNSESHPSSFILSIPPSIVTVAESITSQQPLRKLFVPKTKNHTTIDAWMRGIGVFQMTVGKDHDLKSGVREDLKMMGKGSQKVFWLLPPTTFPTFTKKSPQDINQYALKIPYPEI